MKVTVFGIGYVGLVQAAVLAEVGHQVVCVDIDQQRVENLKNGIIPIYEPGLTPLVERHYQAGRLSFTTDAQLGVAHGEVQFIAVGTPPDEDGSADLKYVLAVASTIAQYMQQPKVIIDKSTVPVGTADRVKAVVAQKLQERGLDIEFDVVSNPEFLKEGAAVNDCMRPDRIVIGCYDERPKELMRELYAPFNRNHDKMVFMDVRSAELTKYAANCMLATKISFMNEMANLAELLGADIEAVRKGIGSDPVLATILFIRVVVMAVLVFQKDVQALIRSSEQHQYSPSILKAVEQVNAAQKLKLPELIRGCFGVDLSGKTFAVWGLSFKPNTDDMREAPSRVLLEALWQAGAKVQAYDPEAMHETRRIYGQRADLLLTENKELALDNADALIICTEWQQFKAPDFDEIKQKLKQAIIFDGRNLFEPERLKQKGFRYFAIGRGDSVKY